MQKLLWIFLFLILVFPVSEIFSQERKQIDFEADLETIDEKKYPGALILRKTNNQVYIIHEGIEMWCDLAFFYKEQNFVKAYQNVRLNQGDTIRMNSRYAEYDGNTQFAFAAGTVNLQSPTADLATDTLYFNRIKQQAYYNTGGTLRDTASVITSRIGRYFMDQDKYSFIQDVVVTNPDYVINSEQLDFYSEAGHAYLYGPSTITSDASKVYCERGFYDTRGDNGYFVKNSKIDYENRTLYGDSLYYDRPTSFASATNNIRLIDTINSSVIKGHYAEMYKDRDSVFITKRAVAITVEEQDSVYVHGDRLVVTGPEDNRILRGFYNVRLFKKDMSGKCDSIHTNELTGLTQMIGRPILWSGLSQMTGDTIHLKSNVQTEMLDSLVVFNNAFLAQKDTIPLIDDPIPAYNQVKGEKLYGLFVENALSQIEIVKNAESINYMRSDAGDLQGIDRSLSGSIMTILEDNALVEVTKYNQVDGQVYPLSKFDKEKRRFTGFKWRGDERLLTKEDIFKGEEPFDLVKIKGIPLPEIEEDFFEEDEEAEYQKVPEVSELPQESLRNREEDAPRIGVPVSEKATIQSDSLSTKNQELTPAGFKSPEPVPGLKKDSDGQG